MRKLNQTFGNVAYGAFSDSNNYATETNNFGETAFGILNKSTIDPDNFTSRDVVKSSKATLFSIGNGTEEERKNVIEIKGNGDVYINGVAGYTGTDTDEAGNIAEEFQGVHDSLDSIHMQKDDDSDLVYTLIVDGEERGTINIPKDQFLEDVNYDDDTKELVFIFVTSDENNKEVRINIGNLVDIYSAGNGLSLTEGQFAIKLDPSTESYITVGADGLKVSGLDAKFDTLTQKDTEQDERIQTAETDIDALQSDLSALKGDGEGFIGNQIQTAVDALKGGVSESYDTLKKIEDNIVSTNGKFDEYLPLSGGTLTGNLYGEIGVFKGFSITQQLILLNSINCNLNSDGSLWMIFDSDKITSDRLIGINVFDESDTSITLYKSGIKFSNKTSSDLLHAAGGTTTLKTINGESLLGSGDIALDAEHITVKDTLGYFSGNNVESALQEIAQPLDTHLQNNTPGMKHIPSGGAANQILAWGANGTAKWENLSNIEVSTEDMLAYGVEWDVTVSDPQLTRIGNTSLHKSLPIQSGMYGCVCQGATIRYRLDDNDWRYKREPDFTQVNLTVQDSVIKITADAFSNLRYDKQWIKINDIEIQIASIDTDSATATLINNEYTGTLHDGNFNCELGSVRNGYDGTVKVYVPGFYIKSVSEGNIRRVWLSTSQVDSTYHYQQPVLVDAYRCTVLNTVPENMGYLSTLPAHTAVSIANTNTYCRGGSNNSNYDQYLENDPRRTQLGKPRTSLSRATMRGYASNANAHLLTYEEYKNIFYWLYVVEYANFNSQATFSSSLDDNGYATGGLGNGVTTMNGNVWSGYNGYHPLTPCGYLDSLGNGSGIEPQVLEAFDMSVNPTKNFGSWTAQTYRDGNNNPYKATMSKGNPTLTITNVARTGQILYCNSQVAAGVATYTVSGLQEGQQISFSCSGQTTQTVTADGPVTMDWGTNGSQTRNINANFTGSCNITITCDTVQSPITAEYPSQSITVNRWRGFDNPFGDIWTNLDGVIIDADADSHSNSMDYVYTCSDPAKFADELTSDYVKIAESTHSAGYVRAFDLGDTANIIASQVGGGSTTFMCDHHWTGNADTTLRTLRVGGYAHYGAQAGFGCLASAYSVSYTYATVGFRSVSIAQ